MHDAFGMGATKRFGNLNGQFQQLISLEGLLGDEMLESLTLQQLHDNEGLTFAFIDVVNRADVRMVESRGSSRFALETFQGMKIFRQFLGQEF